MTQTAETAGTTTYAHRDGTTCHSLECPRLARCSHGAPLQWTARGEFSCHKCKAEADRREARRLSPNRIARIPRRRKGSY